MLGSQAGLSSARGAAHCCHRDGAERGEDCRDERGRWRRGRARWRTSLGCTPQNPGARALARLFANRVLHGEGGRERRDDDRATTSPRHDRLLSESLDLDANPGADRTIAYQYDNGDADADYFDGTAQTKKSVAGDQTETTEFNYNLQGRLAQTRIDQGANGVDTTIDYEYDAAGARVRQTTTETGQSPVERAYLVDDNNATDYSQVLEERAGGGLNRVYLLGHDVLAQTAPQSGVALPSGVAPRDQLYLLYDGHGSTRGLVDAAAQPLDGQIHAYDAYGQMLDGAGLATAAASLTALLYSGEQTDASTGMQYLRARYYDPLNGRFNRLDPFAGDLDDPQSLHKYLYTHGDPINGVDPTGLILGFPALLERYGYDAQRGLAALNIVDKLQTAIDIGQIVLQLATTGTVSPFAVAEIAFGLVPGSKLLRGIKGIVPPFRSTTNFVGQLTGSSALLNTLARNVDELGASIYKNLDGSWTKAIAVQRRLVERIGELGGGFVAQRLGLRRVPGFIKKGPHGFDDVLEKDGFFFILEAKGGSGDLTRTQMSQKWIRENIQRLKGTPVYDRLLAAFTDGRIMGVVTETHIDKVTGEILDPKYTIKHISKIGASRY